MQNEFVFYVSMAAVIVLAYAYLIRISLNSGRTVSNLDEYFFGRNLRAGHVFSTLYAAEMSIATVFIAFFELAPFLGLSLFAAIATFCCGQLLMTMLLPRIKKASQSRYTLPTVLCHGYGSQHIRRAAMTVLALGFAGLFATEVIVGAQLFKYLSSTLDLQSAGTFLVTVIVVAYSVVGGYRNVVKIDKIQTACLLAVVALLGWMGWKSDGLASVWAATTPSSFVPPWALVVNLLVINAAYPLVDMAAWHRIAAAENAQEGQRGFSVGIFFFFVTWSIVLLSAIALTATTGKSGAEALVLSFKQAALGGPVIAVLAGAGLGVLFAALLSTGDAFLICAAQAVFFDLRREKTGAIECPTNVSAEHQVLELARARKLVLALAICSVLLVLALRAMGAKVADLVFIVYGSSTALLPAVLTLLFARDASAPGWLVPALTSIVVGVTMGWGYGILALSDGPGPKALATAIDIFSGAPSAYNAASTALAWSVGTFVLAALIVVVTGRTTSFTPVDK